MSGYNSFLSMEKLLDIGLFVIVINLIVFVGIILIIMSATISFIENKDKKSIKIKKFTPITTFLIILFFFLIYFIIDDEIGIFHVKNIFLGYFIQIAGLIIFSLSVTFHISAKIALGRNWSNKVLVYKDHKLIKNGVYSLVRHPIYASMIWALIGIGFIYLNYIVILLDFIIFAPAMYYRAKQEEKLLANRFKEYSKYIKDVPMFLPKWPK